MCYMVCVGWHHGMVDVENYSRFTAFINTLLHRSTEMRNLCCTKHTGARLREQMMMMMMNQIECKNEKYFL